VDRQLQDRSPPDELVRKLAEDCGPDLVRFIARRLRSAADAKDVAQESYVRLLRLERKDLIRDPRPYLYRIASHILYEFELRRKADTAGLQSWSAERRQQQAVDFVDEDIQTTALRKKLESALSGLSPKCRAVVLLHRRDGMTYDEIAAAIGISPSMVKKYLAQGLLHCRERLKDFR
jgi:RNA polymerase sigma factor (sigma-70 family)